MGLDLRDLLEGVTVARLIRHRFAEVVFETHSRSFFPEIAHRFTRANRYDLLSLDLKPECRAAGLVRRVSVGHGYLEDLDPLSDRILDLLCAKVDP